MTAAAEHLVVRLWRWLWYGRVVWPVKHGMILLCLAQGCWRNLMLRVLCMHDILVCSWWWLAESLLVSWGVRDSSTRLSRTSCASPRHARGTNRSVLHIVHVGIWLTANDVLIGTEVFMLRGIQHVLPILAACVFLEACRLTKACLAWQCYVVVQRP